ncbi:MAG: hypothetical protein CL681_09850 [Blastopirellula sp.]|nr:hypothetical protein [Blastopirellula sp.]
MAEPSTTHAAPTDEARRHLRGSTILLGGRLISLAINFSAQLLLVRALSKADFGAFGFALSIVTFWTAISVMGLDTTARHFASLYEASGSYRKQAGAMLVLFSCIVLFASVITGTLFGVYAFWPDAIASSTQAQHLVLYLLLLTPLEAVDCFLVSLLAAFAHPRTIFIRSYLLGPGLKLLAVLGVLLVNGSPSMLATAYVAGSILGLAICSAILFRVLKCHGILNRLLTRDWEVPLREVCSYSLPQVSFVLSFQLRTILPIFLLERFLSEVSVAEFRAVLPLANLNHAVMATFGLLFVPAAARMFASQRQQDVEQLYIQTASWVTLLSFPIFAVCFAFPESATVFLFGKQYASSSPILAALAMGSFINALMGFNAQTLRGGGHARFVVISDLITIACAVGLQLYLIPRHGAFGAALATCAVLLVQNVINQIGLIRLVKIHPFRAASMTCYLSVALGTFALLQLQRGFSPPLYVALLCTAAVFLLVFFVNRHQLNVSQTLPELMRVPVLRWMIG